MSTEIDCDQPTISETGHIKKNVAEFVKRIKTGLALSEHRGMSIVVQDQAEQLKALFAQSGFIIANLLSEMSDVKWIEQSLSTTDCTTSPGVYSVESVNISLRIRCSDSIKHQIESWIEENDINSCGNVSVVEVDQGIQIALKVLS